MPLHHQQKSVYNFNCSDDVISLSTQVNGEKVRTYMHTELVTVLKRCPKGNQANFTLLRQPQEV